MTIKVLAVALLLLMPSNDGAPDPSQEYLQPYLQEATSDLEPTDQVDLALKVMGTAFPSWEHKYRRGTFDCSEMSACTAWCLQQFGILAEVDFGQVLGVKGSSHSWVVSGDICIEATQLRTASAAAFDRYNVKCLGNLNKPAEWDWWASDYVVERRAWAVKNADQVPMENISVDVAGINSILSNMQSKMLEWAGWLH